MKKLMLLSASFLLVFALYEPSDVTAQGNCEPMGGMANCRVGGRVTINNEGNIVGPPCVEIEPGGSITFNISPPGTTARIEPKNGGSWPFHNGESITLQAPSSDGDYDYNVYFSDGSCIDPRIRVKN